MIIHNVLMNKLLKNFKEIAANFVNNSTYLIVTRCGIVIDAILNNNYFDINIIN